MKSKIIYLIVSSEDDVQLVKGGIGTYLGLLIQAFAKYRPDIELVWLTESPNDNFFVEHRSGCRIFYIPKNNLRYKINRICEKICNIFIINKRNKLVIEAPDWEGLLSDLYSKVFQKNIIKITRLHSILELTKQSYPLFSKEDEEQIKYEHQQLLHTDIISAPTQYVYNFTCSIFANKLKNIPYFIIPNFINNKFTYRSNVSREKACNIFNNGFEKDIINKFNKNVFIIGSLEYRKGTDIAIKIAKKIIDDDNNVHFYFLGHYAVNGNSLTLNNKYSLECINKMISSKYIKNIHICGYFPHNKLDKIYPVCDTFLFTYRHDNFPGAVIESCLTGKNIVYMPNGGCLEMMKIKEQILGLPFEGKNDDELVDNGCVALKMSLKHARKFSAKKIKDKYIEEDIIQQMSKSYGF